MTRADRRGAAVLVLAGLLAGCGTTAPAGPPGPTSLADLRERPREVAPVVLDPCPTTPATPERSTLRPRDLTAADAEVDLDRYGRIPVDGPLVVEDVGDLLLTDGVLGAGPGYAGLVAAWDGELQVAPGTISAPVSLQVLDSTESGRRVAFVEVRVGDGTPVAWTVSEDVGVVTDGGDAAVFAPVGAPDSTSWDMDPLITTYVETLGDQADDASGVCALRRPEAGGPVDAVLTSIGWGDGRYPVVVGTDATGDVVSVVVDGMITPWEWSGLPGTPPPDV